MNADAVTDAVLTAVRETVAEVNPTCHAIVTLDSALDRDLGLDSLVRSELTVRIEDALGRRLSDSLLVDAATPRELVEAARRTEAVGAVAPTVPDLRRAEPAPALPQRVGTLVEALEWHASEHPERVHVHLLVEDPADAATTLTYGDLRDRGRAIAAGLAASDVRPGDRVAIMLPTSLDYFAAFTGVSFAGAIPVPLYPPGRPAQIHDYLERQRGILDNARARALVTSTEAGRIARVLRAPVASLRLVTTVGDLEKEHRTDVRPPVRADDIALLQYTSGSTGSPKGVVLTHHDLLANIRAMARAASAGPDDVFVSWLPLYHDMGLIGAWLGSLCIGFPLVVMSPLSFLMRPARWLRAISDYAATLSAAPNFGFELCAGKARADDLDGIDLGSLRMVFNGAEPVSADTLDRFETRFRPLGLRPGVVAPVYGLAEAAVGLAFPPLGRPPLLDRISRDQLLRYGRAEPASRDSTDATRVVACGRALPGYDIRVADREGRALGDRREGRIEFRGPSATRGYFRNPEETHRLFDGEWLDTGDLGYLSDGDVYLTGRAKDLIIRAGRNLHPEGLEDAVGDLAGVRAGCVAVFATPDPQAGTERLVVAAETRVTDGEAKDALRAAIIDVTVGILGTPPDDVVLIGPHRVPKTSSGKVRRAACRELYERGELAHAPRHPRLTFARLSVESWLRAARRRREPAFATAYALYAWVLALALALATAIALFLVPRRRWRFVVVRRSLRLLAHLARVPVRIMGDAHLVEHGGSIVVANHASWIDGAVLASVLPGEPVFVVGAELGRARWSGPVLRRLGATFVQRATREQAAADTARLLASARAGNTVVIFPEGRLSRVPGLRAFRLGAFITAVEARLPVVPVAVRGTRSLLPPGHRLPHRAPVVVDIGEPITTDRDGFAGAIELQRAARESVLARCDEPDIA